jgi:hypothetical protein
MTYGASSSANNSEHTRDLSGVSAKRVKKDDVRDMESVHDECHDIEFSTPQRRRSPSPHRARDANRKGASITSNPENKLFVADISKSLSETMVKTIGQTMAPISDDIRDIKHSVSGMQERIDEHDALLEAHAKSHKEHKSNFAAIFDRLEVLEADCAHYKAEAAKMGARLIQAEEAPPISPADRSFNRIPNPSLLCVNAKEAIPLSSMSAKVATMLAKAGMGLGDVKLREARNLPAGKRFLVAFKGTPQIASGRVDRILAACRDDDGKWEQIFVEDDQGNAIQVYLGRDKSARMVSTEIATKRLHSLLVAQYPGIDFFPKRQDGEIHSSWRPLAKVDVVSKTECKLLWDVELADELQIDRSKTNEAFKARSSGRPATNWSCS